MAQKNATPTDKEYKELRGRRLNNFSQLQKFNILEEDNEYFFNIFRNYEIRDSVKNNVDYINLYYPESNDGGENIAYKYYENQYLGGIIAMTNDVLNPFEELNEGEQIKIINGRGLYSIVKEIKSLAG